ncbi:hypothetical protein [Streptomyces sp. NPDC001410]|uniref:hypothetical protein n=1 Tax=Streptomyces sp. NPDC001410 TaxID=3364574 RepID=UPI0036768CDF
MTEEELRGLAEQIRAELPALIHDLHERTRVERDLAQALGRPSGTAAEALKATLRSNEAIQERLEDDHDRIVVQAGDPTAALIGVLYICPKQDYSVVREVPTDEVQLCPHDGSVLDRYQG